MDNGEHLRGMFINFSNHPSDQWTDAQIKAALIYGAPIIDIPFPQVDPSMSETKIKQLADQAVQNILSMNPSAVMCQGEFGLSFSVTQRLLNANVTVLYACSERKVYVDGNIKTIQFDFVRFRKYEN